MEAFADSIVPGEGLEPSRGKPSQDFKSCAFFIGPAWMKMAGLYLPEFDEWLGGRSLLLCGSQNLAYY